MCIEACDAMCIHEVYDVCMNYYVWCVYMVSGVCDVWNIYTMAMWYVCAVVCGGKPSASAILVVSYGTFFFLSSPAVYLFASMAGTFLTQSWALLRRASPGLYQE